MPKRGRASDGSAKLTAQRRKQTVDRVLEIAFDRVRSCFTILNKIMIVARAPAFNHYDQLDCEPFDNAWSLEHPRDHFGRPLHEVVEAAKRPISEAGPYLPSMHAELVATICPLAKSCHEALFLIALDLREKAATLDAKWIEAWGDFGSLGSVFRFVRDEWCYRAAPVVELYAGCTDEFIAARGAHLSNSPTDHSRGRADGEAKIPKPPSLSRKERKARWTAEAMLHVREHPEWSDAFIASKVGVAASQLCRSREYQAAAAMARGDASDVRAGFISGSAETGYEVDAVAADSTIEGAGGEIPGSKYVREECSICGDPIRVKPDAVGTGPVCDRCKT